MESIVYNIYFSLLLYNDSNNNNNNKRQARIFIITYSSPYNHYK